MEKKITTEELENLKKLTGEFNTIKSQLRDLTLQAHALCMKVEDVKKEFAVLEGELTKQYGKDSVINLETGVITQKEDNKEVTEESKKEVKEK